MPTCLASRDPKRWDEPNKIDINRKGAHMTFATGPHTCLGMHLAKRELIIVIEAFLSRFKNIRLRPDSAVKWHTYGNFGIDDLPITWDPI
jgi:cytochrome P450